MIIHSPKDLTNLHQLGNGSIINLELISMRSTNKDKRIYFAIKDYYGPAELNDISVEKLLRHIAGRKIIHNLSEEIKSDIFAIKINMQDPIYMGSVK